MLIVCELLAYLYVTFMSVRFLTEVPLLKSKIRLLFFFSNLIILPFVFWHIKFSFHGQVWDGVYHTWKIGGTEEEGQSREVSFSIQLFNKKIKLRLSLIFWQSSFDAAHCSWSTINK